MCECQEKPWWTTRDFKQPPLFLSDEAAQLLAWAIELPKRDHPRSPDRCFDPGEFTPAMAMEEFCGPRNDQDQEGYESRRAWWDRVHMELFHTNMIFEQGYFRWRVSDIARTFFQPSGRLVRLY